MGRQKDLNDYLTLPYTIKLIREDDSTWFARIVELPGCITEGDSPENATVMIYDALASWVESALEDGQPIPEPRSAEEYSGKFIGVELARAVGRAQATPAAERKTA